MENHHWNTRRPDDPRNKPLTEADLDQRRPLSEKFYTEDPRQPPRPTHPIEDYERSAPDRQQADHSLRSWLYASAIVNSALYLVGVFIAGIMLGDRSAWLLALLTMALCYCAAIAQVTWPPARAIALAFVCASIAVGAMAGMVLVFGR